MFHRWCSTLHSWETPVPTCWIAAEGFWGEAPVSEPGRLTGNNMRSNPFYGRSMPGYSPWQFRTRRSWNIPRKVTLRSPSLARQFWGRGNIFIILTAFTGLFAVYITGALGASRIVLLSELDPTGLVPTNAFIKLRAIEAGRLACGRFAKRLGAFCAIDVSEEVCPGNARKLS
jgi:hypothetical protein